MKKIALSAVTLFFATLASAQTLALGLPEIEKVHWESRQLTPCDVNADGRADLAYLNGVERSIEVLVQKEAPELLPSKASDTVPPLAMSRFANERVPTEAAASSFAFGDFSGKGLVEIAYAAKKTGIVFLRRDSEGRWSETHRIASVDVLPYTHAMIAKKLRPDEPVTLIVLLKGRLVLIQNYEIVASYGTLRDDTGYVTVNDINGDGLLDILYDYEAPYGLAYRLQDAEGRFDAEYLQPYASETEKNFAYRGTTLYFFGGNTPFVEERTLVEAPSRPRVAFYGNLVERPSAAFLQINGAPALLLSDAAGSEMTLYRQKPDGTWGAPARFPSLKTVTSTVALASKQPTVAFFSDTERAVGVSTYLLEEKRMSFPKLLNLAEEPVALVGSHRRAWVVMRQGNAYALAELGAEAALGKPSELEGLKRAPEGLLVLQEGADVVLVVFQGREEALFYRLGANGSVAALKVPPVLSRSNFAGLDAARTGVGDSDGDGKDELLVASRATLRIFKLDGNSLSLSDQVLPLDSNANLSLPFFREGSLWAYDSKAGQWLKFEKNAESLWRNTRPFEAPPLPPVFIKSQPLGLLVFCRNAFYSFAPDLAGSTLQPLRRWESELKIEGYNWASLEAFEEDGSPDMILFNQPERLLEIVSFGKEPKSLLNFEVYKEDPYYEGRKGEDIEPREIIAADVTGDGKNDLILLIHNKIITYPQK